MYKTSETVLTPCVVLNFTCFTTKEFTVNVIFPEYEVERRKDKRFKNMMLDVDYKLWYDDGFMAAFRVASRKAPKNLKPAFLQAQQEFPGTYDVSAARAVGRTRNFTGQKLTHEALNLVLVELRQIIDRTPRLAKFRKYFFHIQGKNLKCVAQALKGRSSDNPILQALRLYPIVDWDKQNPSNIVVDVGVEINVNKETIPEEMRLITLLWDQSALRGLIDDNWCSHRLDAYIHSHVVGGLKSVARSHCSQQCVMIQAYHKDKVATYIHADNSIGTGFSAEDGVWGTQKYFNDASRLRTVLKDPRCYGARIEWRLGLWAANEMIKIEPERWRKRFFEKKVLVCVKHVTIRRSAADS